MYPLQVLIAIGRDAVTADLGLNVPGVRMDKNGKVIFDLSLPSLLPYSSFRSLVVAQSNRSLVRMSMQWEMCCLVSRVGNSG